MNYIKEKFENTDIINSIISIDMKDEYNDYDVLEEIVKIIKSIDTSDATRLVEYISDFIIYIYRFRTYINISDKCEKITEYGLKIKLFDIYFYFSDILKRKTNEKYQHMMLDLDIFSIIHSIILIFDIKIDEIIICINDKIKC